MSQPEQPGWRWGPFTFRLPFYHSKLCWPEFFQGLLIAAATGLSLVPLMTVTLAVFSAFPVADRVYGVVQDFLFTNFVPTSSEVSRLCR